MSAGLQVGNFSLGNMKLGRNILIMNMGSSLNCPSYSRGLCKLGNSCYARKCERRLAVVHKRRILQGKWWAGHSAQSIIEEIGEIVDIYPGIKYIRFNEACDFLHPADIWKLDDIARAVKPWGITVYGYTARSDMTFTSHIGKPISFLVKGSGWNGPNGKTVVFKKADAKYYKVGKKFWVCPGENCGTKCRMCMKPNKRSIAFQLH